MAASEKTLIYRGDTFALQSLLSSRSLRDVSTPKDQNYVDLNDLLDLKLDDTRTVKVSFTGDANQLAIIKSESSKDNVQSELEGVPLVGTVLPNKKYTKEENWGNDKTEDHSSSFETDCSSDVQQVKENFTDCREFPENDVEGQPEKSETSPNRRDDCDLHNTDEYLSRKSDSDEEISVFILRNVTEDESHYITTHEIQLSELDHDADGDFGLGSSWDIEDDHRVYSFVDYASFDSDETLGAKESVLVEVAGNQDDVNRSEAVLSTKPENDPSSLEKVAQTKDEAGNSAGQIHLSIKATSRAINEPRDAQENENIIYHSKHAGDISRCVFKDGIKGDKVRDGAKCLIALPGRLHFGGKLKGKDVHEYSSGASSAMSDLDDADKEVRNLTARAFKSLAYPYFDAINFSTSSESSASEHGRGINRWSTFVDLKYANMNVSKGANQNLVTHKSAKSNFHFAKQRESKGITGLTLTSMRAPPVEIFALNGSLINHKNASSKKIELMGKFAQGQSGLIRLTETLNFRCNVKAGASASERRVKCTQNTGGSRSADEVTDGAPSAQSNESSKQSCNAVESMEDAHKKSIFASSLLKNVISKKMQFEQERKMERGEITEPCQAPSPCFASHDSEAHKEKTGSKEFKGLHRQSSKFSEADSDFTIVCLDELGDIVDSNSCDAKDDGRREALALAPETNLEPTNEAGFDTKKGAFEASKSTLLPSQNSAFRSWRDGEVEFPKERKNEQTRERKLPIGHERDFHEDSTNSKFTKMSHLFVPSIQVLSSERELEKPRAVRGREERGGGGGGGRDLRSDKTLYVSNTTRSIMTSKSPEIKISLRSVRDNKSDPFSIAKLLTPNIGCNAANLTKAVDDSKCQALAAVFKSDPSDKVPHFMVRDIRDNKGKLQTPIHQVRDVRKLVKSSYHFVSLDSSENKSSSVDGEHKTVPKQNQYRNPASLSPIVIKFQSVNTHNNVKQSGKSTEPSKRKPTEDIFEFDRSSPPISTEGNKPGTAQIHKGSGRIADGNVKQEGATGLKIENRTSTRRQDKVSETGEKKTDNKMAALEKLQAAVKTMEQLYIFDKNEWKRKTQPQPITDSHVLSLLTSEEHGGTEEEQANSDSVSAPVTPIRQDSFSNPEKTRPARQQSNQAEIPLKKNEKEVLKSSHTPVTYEERNGHKTFMNIGGSLNKNISSLMYSQKSSFAGLTSPIKAPQVHTSSPVPVYSKGLKAKSPKLPVSLKISQPKCTMEERERPNGNEAGFAPVQFISSADSENYLTIPVKPRATAVKQPATSVSDKTATYAFQTTGGKTRTVSPPSNLGHGSENKGDGESHQSPKRSSIVMETRSPDTPTATIYHHPLPITMQAAQPQVICFSPTVQPSPVPTDHFQTTQRKMLLDPTTGNYYLVDTPVQPATRRLFDPETGQYVDVPMPPQTPMTPVPMPISPLAISPGAYAPTYMFYPGYMPTTVIPARTIQSQLSMQSDAEIGDKAHGQTGQQGDGVYMESPYYMSSGKTLPSTPGAQHITSGSVVSAKQPVISITSQQGPRIIAPPSFDGTTMSFVVEHR